MNKTLTIGLATGFLFVAAVHAQDDAKKELAKLEGKWTVTAAERDGKADDTLKGAVRVNSGDKYTLAMKGGKPFGGTYKIDPTKKPKTMDMMPTDGRYKDKTLLAIYELDGDTMKVCFAEPGKERPTEFSSKPGSGHVCIIQKREKP
jgi:uncharacterized protein (TIGR03067 family)